MTKEDRKVYADVSIIINMMRPDLRDKINKKFIDYIENNKDNNYISEIDTSKPIENQNIRYDVKVMLALIYMNYICPEEEKPNLKKDFQKKKEIQNEILNKKYEINFEKSNDNLDNLNIDTNSFSNDKLAEIHKKGIFKQIIEKIKNLFRKK